MAELQKDLDNTCLAMKMLLDMEIEKGRIKTI